MSANDPNLPAIPVATQLARILTEVAALEAQAAALDAQTAGTGTSLVPAAGVDPAVARQQIETLRARASTIHTQLTAKRAEMERLMRAQLAEMNEKVAPLKRLVGRLTEGLDAFGLYFGNDEWVHVLRTGEPAPADTPVTIRQLVLYADEECAVAALTGGIQPVEMDVFDEWLLANPAHLDQVLPESKGLVMVRPKRRVRNESDPWVTMENEQINRLGHLIIRNGENVWRIETGMVPGERLFPATDEFERFFRDSSGTEIAPGSVRWANAQESADARTRHYMKVALLLEGLVHRGTAFHPLPAGGLSFTDPTAIEDGRIQLIADGDPERTLPDASQLTPWWTWLRDLWARADVGMRIVGAFGSEAFRGWNESGIGHSLLTPRHASSPSSNTLHTIDRRDSRGLSFAYSRSESDTVWDPDEYRYRPVRTRARCTLDSAWEWAIPFDLVTVDELTRYLHSRTERHQFIDMFPVIKATIALKHAEAAEEAPFRMLLAGTIARELDIDIETAETLVPGLVDWWKYTNRHHRALAGDPTGEAKALRMIVAEARLRHERDEERSARADATGTILSRLRTEHPDAILIAHVTGGEYRVFTPADDRNVHVHETTVKPRSTTTSEWRLPNPRTLARWNILWSAPRWAEWDLRADGRNHLTGPELAELDATVVDFVRAATRGRRARVVHEDAVLLAVTRRPWADNGRGDWVVYFTSTDPEDAGYHATCCRRLGVSWKRSTSTGQAPMFANVTSRDLRSWYPKKHPWLDSHGNNTGTVETVVFIDPTEVAALDARSDAENTRRSDAHEQVFRARHLYDQLAAAWTAARTVEERARFDATIGDPDLWEGHAKLVKLPAFPADWHGELPQVTALCRKLAETGVDPAGLTVTEAATAVDASDLAAALPAEITVLVWPVPGAGS